jgi:hypothetical protein
MQRSKTKKEQTMEMQSRASEERADTVMNQIQRGEFCFKESSTKTTMPQHIWKKQYVNLPPLPRHPSWCAYDTTIIAAHLIRKQNVQKWQVDYILGMLDESYLLSLPRLKTYDSPVGDRSPQCLRALWCRWVAKILSWREESPEGHKQGFSPQVYEAFRGVVFLFPKVERDAAGRRVPPGTTPCTYTIRTK